MLWTSVYWSVGSDRTGSLWSCSGTRGDWSCDFMTTGSDRWTRGPGLDPSGTPGMMDSAVQTLKFDHWVTA